jgi:L-seryl-tRNA(Ser) seleniumtransferase
VEISEDQQKLLRILPGVDRVLGIIQAENEFKTIPRAVLTRHIRLIIEAFRQQILNGSQKLSEQELSGSFIVETVRRKIKKVLSPHLVPLINATGVVVHTNLGRSLLSRRAIENLTTVSGQYSNLEFDLEKGQRGSRYSAVEDILCEISGAEAALVVNNNAGAVLICLETIARQQEVVVSRGELVEIGGSFRIPDVMTKSGAILKEVGTTNRTHKHDYINAINPNTGLLLKVHTSNYSVVGFTASVSLKELVGVGAMYNLPVMEDLGSGTFINFSNYGLMKEPTVQESVATGADVITFSGDKLLGGPQAGIIVGKKALVDKIKKNPVNRALRIDKMTLAALESTLCLYRNPQEAVQEIPTLKMLLQPVSVIEKKCNRLCQLMKDLNETAMTVNVVDVNSRAGGGSLPLLKLPSKGIGVTIKGKTSNEIEHFMRNNYPPIIGRIENDLFILDVRTIQDEELAFIEAAFKFLLRG